MHCCSTHYLLNYYSDASAIKLLMVVNGLNWKWTREIWLNLQNMWQTHNPGEVKQLNHLNGSHCLCRSSTALCRFGASTHENFWLLLLVKWFNGQWIYYAGHQTRQIMQKMKTRHGNQTRSASCHLSSWLEWAQSGQYEVDFSWFQFQVFFYIFF